MTLSVQQFTANLSLRWKLIVSIILFGTVVTGILSALLYHTTRTRIRNDFRKHLQETAGLGAAMVPAELHQTLKHPDQENGPAYMTVKRYLQKVQKTNPDIHFIYTMAADKEDRLRFVVDAETDPENIAHLGEEYTDASPFLKQHFKTISQPVSEADFYTDHWGTWLTGYAPIFNTQMEKIGVLGIDVKAERIIRYEKKLLFLFAGVFCISILLSVLLGIWLGNRLSAPVLVLKKSAEQISRGDFSSRVAVTSNDELGVLSRTFNTMSEKLQLSMQQLKDENLKRKAAEKKYRSIFENAMEGIFQSSFDGRFVMANPELAKMLGYDTADHMVKAISDISRQLYVDSKARNELLERLEAGETVSNLRVKLRKQDDSCIWAELTARVAKDENGEPCIEGLIKDISEQIKKEAAQKKEAEARAATRAKSEFLANMSHEIRTPMNAVIGLTHLALKTELSQKQADYLKKIMGSAQHLLNIINDILDFSKIEAGKLSMETIRFELEKVMDHLAGVLSFKAEEKELELLFRLDENIPPVLSGDPFRLEQILTNLINNAIKFTDKGSILLSVKKKAIDPDKGRICLEFKVKDTGIGLTRKQMDRLFKSFSQADESITRKHGGTGLGLAICKQLVEMMGGQIRVESRTGEGSAFIFTAWMNLLKDRAKRVFSYPPDLEKMKVLVVDDNSIAREILSDILESFSFRVTLCPSGDESLAELVQAQNSNDPFKLVVMDWKMPGRDGIETAEAIRNHLDIPTVPKILMLTAYGREDIRQKAEDAGVSYFLIKPVNPSLLFDAVLSIFSNEKDTMPAKPHEKGTALPGLENIRNARILLVEDNEINQQVAQELLSSENFIVTTAGNGRIAIDMLSGFAGNKLPDIILMDLQMPEMDGLTATTLIRKKDGPLGKIPIIAMTAHALEDEKNKCFEAGMDDHVAKPIDPDALFKTLIQWIKPGTRITQPPENPDELKKIPSGISFKALSLFDTEAGLRRVAGNETLYRDLIIQFARKHESTQQVLEDYISRGDYKPARDLVHALKGSAGNLGAAELNRTAAVLEPLLEKKEDQVIQQALPAFFDAFKDCILQIQQFIMETTPKDVPSSNGRKSNKTDSDNPQKPDSSDLAAVCGLAREILDLITSDYSLALEKTNNLIAMMEPTPAAELGPVLQEQMNLFEEDAALATLQKIIGVLDPS